MIFFLPLFLITVVFAMLSVSPASAGEQGFQQPTVDVPTVTGTPPGPTARVNLDNDQINVRSGPGTDYAEVGILIAGQTVPALGRSAGGSWIQIGYAGVEGGVAWVYSPLVTVLKVNDLDIVEAPPKPTPRVTPTIDPTLAAQFIVEVPATRLPTFTAPAPLLIPTFPVSEQVFTASSFPRTFPVGVIIIALAIIGLLGSVAGLLFRR